MRTSLTDQQIKQYREDGFLKICGFLNPDELVQWREKVDTAVNARAERIPGFGDGGKLGDDYYDNVFKQRVNLWRTDNSVKELALNKEIAAMTAKLEDVSGVRIWHDQALYKQGWANPTSCHIDDPYWPFYSRNATTIWIALDDTTVQNGALYFLPGKHKLAAYDNVLIGKNIGSLFDVYPDWKECDPVCVEMKGGDASFHNGLTPHAAGPNMTPNYRRAFAVIFMPDGCTFNGQRSILPQQKFDALAVGDALNDDELNPILYSSA